MADLESGDGWQHLAQADGAGPGEDAAPQAGRAANRPPQAADVCIATAEGAAVEVPVLGARQRSGRRSVAAARREPARERPASLNPDGTVTFTPDAPGLQSFRYQVGDGRGGGRAAATSRCWSTRADGELERPVLAGLDDQELARARARLRRRRRARGDRARGTGGRGPAARSPAPGSRSATEPGQSIELAGGEFASASYIVVEGGLLVVTEDGRLVYLSDFVDSAESGPPPTLAVAGGPAVAADQLLADLQPIGAAGGGTAGRPAAAPAAGPQHGGGAGFSPYDPGDIGPGLGLTGPLLPTALGPRPEFLLRRPRASPATATAAPADPAGPAPSRPGPGPGQARSGPRSRPGSERAAPADDQWRDHRRGRRGHAGRSTSSRRRRCRTLSEGGAVDLDLVNGVDQRNLVLGPNADATIIFRDEVARFQNTLGVVLIGADGTLGPARIVFAAGRARRGRPALPVRASGRRPAQPRATRSA